MPLHRRLPQVGRQLKVVWLPLDSLTDVALHTVSVSHHIPKLAPLLQLHLWPSGFMMWIM